MLDCKKALDEADGDYDKALDLIRVKGLKGVTKREGRLTSNGLVVARVSGGVGVMLELNCETDFVASSDGFKAEADALAKAILEKGEAGVGDRATQIDDLKITLKEKIEVGETIRFEAAAGNILDSYTHVQGGRGVNGVIVEMSGASVELAHDIAVHIAFARPRFLQREDIPADVLEKERETLEAITRNEGKPEQAIAKIVEGRIAGFFKDVCLLEQPYAKDDKVSISQLIGAAKIVRFAQVEIG